MSIPALTLRRFDADHSGLEVAAGPESAEAIFADLVIQEAGFTAKQLQGALLATDMDRTMFKDAPDEDIIGDIGILVFVEKLADPSFWHFDAKRFESLLMPEVYRHCAISHLNGGGTLGVAGSICQRILDLVKDIVELYALQKKLVKDAQQRRQNGDRVTVDINTPVVNEFALKMIEFDHLIKNIEHPLMAQGRAKMLMRTRFFSGTNVGVAREIAKKIMKRSNNGNGRKNSHVRLAIHEETTDAARDLQMPYNQRIADIDTKHFRRVVSENEPVRRLVTRLRNEYGTENIVITANLAEVAEAAVRFSRYREAIKRVIGSHLDRNGDGTKYKAQFQGVALHGNPKADVLKEIEATTGKKALFAIGDSDIGDLPMGLQAIKNGGIFVVTGPDFEEVCRKFNRAVRAAMANGTPNAAQRTWVATYG